MFWRRRRARELPRSWWVRFLRRVARSLLVLAVLTVGYWVYFHYQAVKKLDEAVAALDAKESRWRLADLEADRAEVADDDNAGPIVLSAAATLPNNWPPLELEEAIKKAHPPYRLPEALQAQLAAALDAQADAVAEARRLVGYRTGRYAIYYKMNVIETLLPHTQDARTINRLLTLDALRRGGDDLPGAWLSVRASLAAARSLGDEPMAITQLVRSACGQQSCLAAAWCLGVGEVAASDLHTFQNELEAEVTHPGFSISVRGERAVWHAMLEALESGAVPICQLDGSRCEPDLWERVFGFHFRDRVRDCHPEQLRYTTRMVELAGLPAGERVEQTREWERVIREAPKSLATLMLPALDKLEENDRRGHALLRSTAAALAAERYRLKHGRWPATLDALVPDFLSVVPLDPCDGEPLRYRKLADGIAVYSVGWDGKDDGGTFDPDNRNVPDTDWGVRLWDVDKRGSAPPDADKPGEQP